MARVCWEDGPWYPAFANFGTVDNINTREYPVVGVHILNFSEDLYGKTLKIEFLEQVQGVKARCKDLKEYIAELDRIAEAAKVYPFP